MHCHALEVQLEGLVLTALALLILLQVSLCLLCLFSFLVESHCIRLAACRT